MDRMLRWVLMGTVLWVGCDGPVGEDAGIDSGPGVDSGMRPDSGRPDSGTRDAGPSCTVGCSFVELELGLEHSCARRENGEVWCWGRDLNGQLGDGPARETTCGLERGVPVDCGGPVQVRAEDPLGGLSNVEDAIQISASHGYSTCMTREIGGIWCWGLQGVTESSNGTPRYWLAATPIQSVAVPDNVPWEGDVVTDGWVDTCALDAENGSIVCYGENESGQLGVGESGDPIRLPDPLRPVIDPADTVAPFDPFLGALDVVASGLGQLTCARTVDGVWCWGMNREGQLGDDNADHGADCTPAGLTNYDCSRVPVRVGGSGTPLTDVASIDVGLTHACALGATGTLRCWGDNRSGQLAQATTTGSFPLPTTITLAAPVAEVATGGFFTCARLTDGTVWCWGYNYFGALGDGMQSHGATCTFGIPERGETLVGDCSSTPVQVMGIDDATHIQAGPTHACAIRANGQVWCWGDNNRMQLADPSLARQFAPIEVVGLPL